MAANRDRRDVVEALAAAIVFADLSDSRHVAGFAEEVRAVGAWAEEVGDEVVGALAHEAASLLESVRTGEMTAADAAAVINEMIGVAVEAADPEPARHDDMDRSFYAADPVVVAEFVVGAREQLDEAEALLSSCMTGDAVEVGELFRCFHTLKGVAGFLSLAPMATLAHDVETRFERLRAESLDVDGETVEHALAAVDTIRAIVDEVDAGRNAAPAGSSASQSKSRRATSDSVRVDAAKLEYLLDELGELAVAEAEIAAALRRFGDEAGLRSLERFQRIARDLQAATTSLRMVDLAPTFRKMTRVVRDMIASSGKPVDLVVSGGDTELDRQIVESLGDPLVHLLRNAVDHGIESPERRRAAGKPERGRVELRAFHRTGNVHIEVCDDGRGIDPADLLAKAASMGLDVDPSQAMDLIFRPGFSTAQEVTEISGRGVGLDAVAAAVEGLRGHLDVRSERGQGTTFTIRLPLTLAVIDGIVLRAGTERYVVPTQHVERTMSASDATLVKVAGGGDVLVTEDDRLAVVAATEPLGGVLEHGSVAVVLADGDHRFAILVDEVIGQQSLVIKPLSGPASRADGVAGGSLMGDGRVALVLDPAGIVRALGGHGRSR